MSQIWLIYPCKKMEGWGKKSGRIHSPAKSSIVCVNSIPSKCRDLRAFLRIKLVFLDDLLRVKDLTFCNSESNRS